MNCGKCGAEMVDEEMSLKIRGHGIYEQCAQVSLCVGDGVLLHARKGGIFLKKKQAPSHMPVKCCPECSMVTFAAQTHSFEAKDSSISTVTTLAAIVSIIIGVLVAAMTLTGN